AEQEGVEEAAVVGRDDQAALDARVLAPESLEPEPDQEGRHEERPQDQVERPVDALRPGVLVVAADPVGADPLRRAGLRRRPGLLARALPGPLVWVSLVGHREAVHAVLHPVTACEGPRSAPPRLSWDRPAG